MTTTTTQTKPFKVRGRALLTDLIPAANNPREITSPNLNGLAFILDKFGQVQDVVVNKRTGRIVGGHQRVAALQALQETHADVTWVDLSDAEEDALRVALNNPHTQGTWTDDLDKILGDLSTTLPPGLFADLRLDALLGPDALPPLVTEPVQHTVPKRDVTTAPGDWAVVVGDNRVTLRGMASDSVDAVVTDPPYELGFMGRAWDQTGIAYDRTLWAEVLRVLKPGGYLVAFGGTRTYHRMVCAIEDAGFEVRDQLAWMFGTGFPKSLDVGKALDNAAGVTRPVVGNKLDRPGYHLSGHQGGTALGHGLSSTTPETRAAAATITAPVSDAAVQWDGYGTALKPAHEPILLARKPLVGTVAENITRHGTGALNIAGARLEDVPGEDRTRKVYVPRQDQDAATSYDLGVPVAVGPAVEGRFPSNVILDAEAAAHLPEGARRFFYCPKTARGEREAGLDALPRVTGAAAVHRKEGSAGTRNPRAGAGRTTASVKNIHPTVKPVDLMRYLVGLVTPPGGTVLDPFMGSGSTGVGALLVGGVSFLGLELETPHACIAWHRLTWWAEHAADWASLVDTAEDDATDPG